MFEEVKRFIRKYKRLPNFNSLNENESKLGNWLIESRRNGELSIEQFDYIANFVMKSFEESIISLFIKEKQDYIARTNSILLSELVMPEEEQNQKLIELSLAVIEKTQNEIINIRKESALVNSLNEEELTIYIEEKAIKIFSEGLNIFHKNTGKFPDPNSSNRTEAFAGEQVIDIKKRYKKGELTEKSIGFFENVEGWEWD